MKCEDIYMYIHKILENTPGPDTKYCHDLKLLQIKCENIYMYVHKILENTPGPDTKRIKKKIIKIFQQNSLKITIDANVVQANFLDVTFNLQSDKY